MEIHQKADATESWNGTLWTTENNLNEGRINPGGAGTVTSGLAFGGDPGPEASKTVEEWSGTGIITETVD